MRADLHIHSVYSDGNSTPEQLAFRLAEAGVSLCSITDHDNMGGWEEKRIAAQKYGLSYVQGWEVSSYEDCKIHVLGYACEAGKRYEEFLEERRRGGLLRARDMLEKANDHLGLKVTMSEVEKEHLKKEAPMHTMHVVRAFARKLNKKVGETYLTYFDRGMPAYSDLYRPTPKDAIEVIHDCGGIAVLAHPGRIQMSFSEREKLMLRLVSEGIDGIECTYTTHTVEETEYFTEFADRHRLLKTGGSDFHAEDGRHFLGRPPFFADIQLLEALKLR